MNNVFRIQTPIRTCLKQYKIYGQYKSYLKKDFNNRCGYTNCSDFWFGGTGNFHIDHFIPWKKYPAQPNLKTDYSNLVYCCSYVNILKSDDETAYLDPCNDDYNIHFYRDSLGHILVSNNSKKAIYMHNKLKLYLKRYQIIWMLENLFTRMESLKAAIEKSPDGLQKDELKYAMADLACIMLEYKNYLSENQ